MKKFNLIKFKMADLRPLQIDKFSRKRDSLNIFLCIAPKCIPYVPLIAWMSLKLDMIRTEIRSWWPKRIIIGHYFFNLLT